MFHKEVVVADFRDFIKNFNENNEQAASAQNNNVFDSAVQKSAEEKAKDVIEKYSSFSEDELAMELAKQIKLKKQNNQYNKNNILSQIDALSSFLTPEQQARIKEILDNAEA